MRVAIKRLNDLAKMPTQGSDYAAGYDLYAATSYDITIQPHQTVKIGTGLAMAIPEMRFGAIFARSGIATKQGLRPANCVGVIDSDYRGEVIVALHNDSDIEQVIPAGSRIAQLVIMDYNKVYFNEVNELDATERGEGGFGSTGTK
jgi:dUTP pyrophosphatase